MNTLNMDFLSGAFSKIYQGLEPKYIEYIESEMIKLVPSPESVVFLSYGYSEQDNLISICVYVSKPLPIEQVKIKQFDKIFTQWILSADTEDLPILYDCIERMEKKEGLNYTLDGIPVIYHQELEEYCFHFIIQK